MRRTHLQGHRNILKRLLIHVAGFNLGLVMRRLFGIGKPRVLQGLSAEFFRLFSAAESSLAACWAYLLVPLWLLLLYPSSPSPVDGSPNSWTIAG